MQPVRLGDFKATQEQLAVVGDVITNGMITEGKYTKLFEQEWAKYIGVKHCIACTNGTVGLMLVMKAAQMLYGKKLKFAVPATTFPATLNAVLLTDNRSYLCDVGDDLLININEEDIKKRKIDGVVPVHLMGYPADMDKMLRLKEKYGLFVIEDCCEATGSSYRGRKVGSLGDAGVFSFFMSHCLGIGELGCITTNNDKLAEVIRSIKNHGRVGSNLQFNHKYIGYNFKTTEFMTGMAWCEIKNADEYVRRRQKNVSYLNAKIKNKNLFLPMMSTECSYLGYPLKASSKEYRAKIIKVLTESGIESREMFPCLARQEAYNLGLSSVELRDQLPISKMVDELYFYLPCHHLLTEEQLDQMVDVINSL